jgi:hypothetical protein
LLDRLGQLVEGLERQLSGKRDVKGVVYVRLVLPAIHPALDRACHVVFGMNPGEVDVRGRAAKRHPARVLFRTECKKPRFARLHRDSVAQMRMRLDSAGHYQLASRVDHLGGLDRLVLEADKRYLSVLDANTPPAGPMRHHDIATANREIEHDALSTT